MTSDEVRAWVAEHNVEAMFADGYDDAIIGVAERCGQPTLIVYDIEAMIDVLVDRDGMSPSDALEFIEFNVVGAWVGVHTPVFLRRLP